MDAIDNPDHGRRVYEASGVRVEENPFDPSKVTGQYAPAPSGGPLFPAMSDVQISSTPT